jgi:hypothetical protein
MARNRHGTTTPENEKHRIRLAIVVGVNEGRGILRAALAARSRCLEAITVACSRFLSHASSIAQSIVVHAIDFERSLPLPATSCGMRIRSCYVQDELASY